MAGRFSIETVFKAVDRVTAPVTRMQNRVGKFTRSMERGLRKANRALGFLTRGLKRGATAALRLGSAGIVAGVTATAFAITKLADAADVLAKRSRRLDFPIEELQEWNFVAEQSGFVGDEFSKSLEGMAKRMGEARAGTGSLFTFLKKTDRALLRQVATTTDSAVALELMIKALQDAEDPLQRAALANAAFGRQGLKMSNIAELGAKRIAKLRLEQRENGVVTREQAEAAEAYNDSVSSLTRSLTGLLQSVLLPMLPKLTETVRVWREWVIANKALLQQNIVETFTKIKNVVVELAPAFLKFIRFLVDNGSAIGKTIAGVTAFIVILNTLIGVMTLVNLVMAANPFVLMVAGVVALTAVIVTLIGFLVEALGGFDAIAEATGKFFFGEDRGPSVEGASGAARRARRQLVGSQGSADPGATDRQVVSPQERTARSIEETREISTAEVTIKAEPGTSARQTRRRGRGANVSIIPSGAF